MHMLITGTSSGIGSGLAGAYLKRGEVVSGISRRTPAVFAGHDNYRHLKADLTDGDFIRKKVPAFLHGTEKLDLVILNSGILGSISMMNETGVPEMKAVMEINLWANKNLLDVLFRSGIRISQVVGMSSKASLRSSPGWGSYALSKAGLNMLMNIYAKEYPDTHFCAFAPGLVDSEIQEYIYNLKAPDRFPTAKKLREARYTELMPDPMSAAPKLMAGIQKALSYESGSFVDVREM